MNSIKREFSVVKPEPLVVTSSGYFYNYDIKDEGVKSVTFVVKEPPKEVNTYSCIPLYLSGKPEYKKTVEATIRMFLTQSEEFDLINSYNSAKENGDTVALNNYAEYLQLLKGIKEKTKAVFTEYSAGDK